MLLVGVAGADGWKHATRTGAMAHDIVRVVMLAFRRRQRFSCCHLLSLYVCSNSQARYFWS